MTITHNENVDLVPSLEPVQLLRPDGARVADERFTVDLDDGALLVLYEHMVVTRALDKEFVNLQRQGELAVFPSCRGQEGVQVGAASALRPTDWMFPGYRELGMFTVRGVDMGGIAAMWRGNCHGGRGLIERRCGPMSIPIATQALHAVGVAMGAALEGSDDVAVACVGDGGTSAGDFHEALNFAAVFEAPCIFLVQNNAWAISVPIDEQCKAPSLAHKGIGYGMPGIRVDGNDVLASYAVVREAVDRARAGRGPTLVEAVTYRMEAHTTADDAGRYQPREEQEAWARLDPIDRFERYLAAAGLLGDDARAAVAERVRAATTTLRAAVVGMADPDPGVVFAHVYADPPRALLEQADELRRELGAR